MKKLALVLSILFLLFFVFPASAQIYSLSGTVRDSLTREALAFVSIGINDGKNGTTTNVDGKFTINSSTPIQKLKFSYLGYVAQEVRISSATTSPLFIRLKQSENKLQEVVIRPGENPAHRIIRNTTANRDRNDPSKIDSYTYITYDKFYVTGNPTEMELSNNEPLVEYALKYGSDSTKKDSLPASGPLTSKDSTMLEGYLFFAKQHIFMSESVSKHSFIKPDLSKELVLATRVSGFSNPSFAVLEQDGRSFSIYPNLVNFYGKKYLSPLSEGSTRKYDFQLEDTTYTGTDTTFIISFKPIPNKNFTGLKGQLHISTNGWAVENVIAESAEQEQLPVKLQQQFTFIDNKQWFPTQVTTEIQFKSINVEGIALTAFNRSYISNIDLEPNLQRRAFNAVSVKLAPDAAHMPDSFWQVYRHDTLSIKEQNTYVVMDSLGRAEKFDKKLKILEILLKKRIPVGPVDLDMVHLLPRVNRYEGLRLGLGVHTNQKISEFFSVGGYVAYGFKDKGWKHGSDLIFNIYKPSDIKLTFNYFEDILESGGVRFAFDGLEQMFGRELLIQNFDKVTHYSSAVSMRALKYLDLRVALQQEYKRSTNGYSFQTSENDNLTEKNTFQFTEMEIGARYAFREKLIEMFNQRIALGTKYPVIWAKYTQGFNGLLDGAYSYQKFDVKAVKSFTNRSLGSTTFKVHGGLVAGSVPYANLYNGQGSFAKKHWYYLGQGFETMYLNEFLSDRYTSVLIKHSFEKLLYKSENFDPVLEVVTNIGFGSLKNPENHKNIDFKTMEKGYYESGLLVNNLLKSSFTALGVGAFYRYGPYANPTFKENLAIKLSVSLAL